MALAGFAMAAGDFGAARDAATELRVLPGPGLDLRGNFWLAEAAWWLGMPGGIYTTLLKSVGLVLAVVIVAATVPIALSGLSPKSAQQKPKLSAVIASGAYSLSAIVSG